MSLKLYRRDPDGGGLEPGADEPGADEPRDWRSALRSRRWDPAPIENPDVQKISPLMGVLFFACLGALTFIVLLLGYGTGFWG